MLDLVKKIQKMRHITGLKVAVIASNSIRFSAKFKLVRLALLHAEVASPCHRQGRMQGVQINKNSYFLSKISLFLQARYHQCPRIHVLGVLMNNFYL